MSSNTNIYKNVRIEGDAKIDLFTIIGIPPKGKKNGELPTIIGKNSLIRSHTAVYAGNEIGDNFQTGHGVLIREENKIGNNVSIGSHAIIEHHIKIGDNVRIHGNVFIPEYSVLEDDCWIGPGVIFTNARYPNSKNAKKNLIGPIVKKGAIIGAGVILLPGIIVGEKSFIGAGSVVVGDVTPGSVLVGNPARKIKTINDINDYNL